MSARLDEMLAARRRSTPVARLRALAQAGQASRPDAGPAGRPAAERCDICRAPLPDDHRHLLHLDERRIVCACEACWALHSGDPEYRPAGTRTIWLEPFDLDDELWARLQIPIALAFFMRSSVTGGVVAFYPSPAGATESELPLEAWEELTRRNPILSELDPDAEALIINQLTQPAQCAIAPIDRCYELVGLIKSRWEGISGGAALEEAVPAFFAALRARAGVAGAVR
ncbi:MAG: hypothetical protein JOZ98_04310 [Solirubrobacterales bacterium]|nr:hypothetical protein [Solirubrobacterales bacterium]MBV9422108.1 hypothetical protein [Solirubrobacterales bacterium]MBV9796775.1 hypothetical protein [Solirubrobacterales bacterium]